MIECSDLQVTAYSSRSLSTNIYVVIAGEWMKVWNYFREVHLCPEWQQDPEGHFELEAFSAEALATVSTYAVSWVISVLLRGCFCIFAMGLSKVGWRR